MKQISKTVITVVDKLVITMLDKLVIAVLDTAISLKKWIVGSSPTMTCYRQTEPKNKILNSGATINRFRNKFGMTCFLRHNDVRTFSFARNNALFWWLRLSKLPKFAKPRQLAIFLFIFLTASVFAKSPNPNPPKSVVALSKSVAEMWTLSGGELSGTTDDALTLPSAENAISVGSLTTTNIEAIVSLNPNLVILTKDIPVHKKIDSNLRELKIKTYIADIKNFSDYENAMRDFTNLTGRSDLFQKNVLDVKSQIEEIIKKARAKNELSAANSKVAANSKTSQTFLFMRVSPTKNKVLKNHFGNEIFENLGLVSIVNDKNALNELNLEAILAANPDYIFVTTQGSDKKAQETFYKSFESNAAWKTLRAVKNGNVIILPKELFNYKPNARWAEAYEYVAKILEK